MTKPIQTRTSVCPYDCPDACGLTLIIEDDKLQQVQGLKTHSFTRGTLCQKMQRYERTVHHIGRSKHHCDELGPRGVVNLSRLHGKKRCRKSQRDFSTALIPMALKALCPIHMQGRWAFYIKEQEILYLPS